MPRRPADRDFREESLPPDRSLTSRLAWAVIGLVVVGVLLRATVVTVVTVHGAGMEPTIRDGDLVVLVRGTRGVSRGDIVVYEPAPAEQLADTDESAPEPRAPNGEPSRAAYHASNGGPVGPSLPNTAVVDREEIEKNWQKIQGSNAESSSASGVLRVARVLAVPGDTVAFNVPGAALGLAINGQPLRQKDAAPPEFPLTAVAKDGETEDGGESPTLPGSTDSERASTEPKREKIAYEWLDDLRYPVVPDQRGSMWSGMGLPDDGTPVQVTAEAYLILADNRPEGACCDSRALGWIAEDGLQGEIYARLDRDDQTGKRGLQWLP